MAETAGTTTISLQLPTATKAALEQRAGENFRSMSAEVRLALAEHLRADQRGKEDT